MNTLIEPFLYETATTHQSELREWAGVAKPAVADGAREPSRTACFRLHWCPREAGSPSLGRLLRGLTS